MIGTAQQTLHQREGNIASWNEFMKANDDPNVLTADQLLGKFLSGEALAELREMFVEMWQKVNLTDIKRIFDAGVEFAKLPSGVIKEYYDEFIAAYTDRLAAFKSRTQAARFRVDKVRDEINEGLRNRESIGEIAERIGGYFEPKEVSFIDPLTGKESTYVGHTTAMTIAATETHTAVQFSQQEYGRAAGMTAKQWLHSGKLAGRTEHIMMDGFTTPIDRAYTLPGGTQLMYPGDPNGPAEHVINCGCDSFPVYTQDELLAPMTPDKKRQAVGDSIQARHPNWSADQVSNELNRLMPDETIQGLAELTAQLGEITS